MKNNESQTFANEYHEEEQNRSLELRKNDIAVIGMACRFPGAENYEEFWKNLKQGQSNIREIPPERWDWKAYWGDPKTEINKCNSKWGGFITDVDAFDPGFFNLSAREAETMDFQKLNHRRERSTGFTRGGLS